MPRRHATVEAVWEPTTQQLHAAKLLASCHTWEQTAEVVGVKSLQTIHNWLQLPGFQALVSEEEAAFDARLEAEMSVALSEMVQLWRQFVRGEVAANDKRIPHIRPTIEKYMERIYGFAAPANAAAAAQSTVLVNVNGGTDR